MALPGAALLSVTPGGIDPIALADTDHYRLWRGFMLDPDATVAEMLEG